jgi:hypothetical protein
VIFFQKKFKAYLFDPTQQAGEHNTSTAMRSTPSPTDARTYAAGGHSIPALRSHHHSTKSFLLGRGSAMVSSSKKGIWHEHAALQIVTYFGVASGLRCNLLKSSARPSDALKNTCRALRQCSTVRSKPSQYNTWACHSRQFDCRPESTRVDTSN